MISRVLIALAGLSFVASSSFGAILAAETFGSYTLGNIHQQAGVDVYGGFTNASGNNLWSVHQGGSGTQYNVADATPLALGQYVAGDISLSPWNQAARVLDNRGGSGTFAAYIAGTDDFDNDQDINQGLLYFSVFLRLDGDESDSSYFGLGSSRFDNGAGDDSHIRIGKFGGSTWKVDYDSGTDIDAAQADLGVAFDGSAEQFVVRLDFDNDLADVWVNPTSESDASTQVAFTGNMGLAVQSLRLNRQIEADHFFLGESFDDVTSGAAAVPEPSTYAMIFGALALALAFWMRRR